MSDLDIINQLEHLITVADQMKSSYFWHAPATARERRDYEKRNSVPAFRWEENGHTWAAAFTVRCSTSKIYAKGEYYRDGNKTTLTAIRNSLQRMRSVEGGYQS